MNSISRPFSGVSAAPTDAFLAVGWQQPLLIGGAQKGHSYKGEKVSPGYKQAGWALSLTTFSVTPYQYK